MRRRGAIGSDTAKRPAHEPTVCQRQRQTRNVSGGGRNAGHSDGFQCGTCGRVGRYALNYLGSRAIVCDGQKFTKQAR